MTVSGEDVCVCVCGWVGGWVCGWVWACTTQCSEKLTSEKNTAHLVQPDLPHRPEKSVGGEFVIAGCKPGRITP